MAYVGNPIDTQNTFQSLVGKRFDGDGSTTDFTLDVVPGNVLDIEVFVGNVRQDPNSAYTVSGTTLSFTGAPPSGTNNIYVVHQAKSVGTIDVPTGSVAAGSLATSVLTGQTDIGAAIADSDLFLVDDGAGGTLRKTAASRIKTYAGFSVSDITGATELAATPADTDELIISDAGTLKRIDFSHIKSETNEPYFLATGNGTQSLTEDQNTTIQYNTLRDSLDSASGFNTSTYTYTVQTGGAGFWFLAAGNYVSSISQDKQVDIQIHVAGSEYFVSRHRPGASVNQFLQVFGIHKLSVGTAVLVKIFHNDNSARNASNNANNSFFGGFRIKSL